MTQSPPPHSRHYQRHHQDPDPAVLVVWGLIVFILVCYGMVAYGAPLVEKIFVNNFAFVPNKLRNGRGLLALFLHVLLHANISHLLLNLSFLLAFGIPLAKRLRGGLFLTIFFFAAMAGAFSEFLLDPQDEALRIGASGGVSGLMGALLAFPIVQGRARLPGPFASRKRAWRFAGLWLVFNALVGLIAPITLGSNVAWIGHCGGFFGGFAFCAVVILLRHQR